MSTKDAVEYLSKLANSSRGEVSPEEDEEIVREIAVGMMSDQNFAAYLHWIAQSLDLPDEYRRGLWYSSPQSFLGAHFPRRLWENRVYATALRIIQLDEMILSLDRMTPEEVQEKKGMKELAEKRWAQIHELMKADFKAMITKTDKRTVH